MLKFLIKLIEEADNNPGDNYYEQSTAKLQSANSPYFVTSQIEFKFKEDFINLASSAKADSSSGSSPVAGADKAKSGAAKKSKFKPVCNWFEVPNHP